MSSLILFSSVHGTTRNCVEKINEELINKAEVIDVKLGDIDVNRYDVIHIASSIYAGKFQSEMKRFLKDNEEGLKSKRLGFIISCKDEKDIDEYLNSNVPKSLIDNIFMKEHIGYEINLEKMNFFERFLIKSLMQINESYSAINHEGIKRIIEKINQL